MSALSSSVMAPGRGTGMEKAGTLVRHIAHTLIVEWTARRAARNVESLSDAMLHDIGIARGEIDQAVRHGRFPRG